MKAYSYHTQYKIRKRPCKLWKMSDITKNQKVQGAKEACV
jgi:hypothetical protein